MIKELLETESRVIHVLLKFQVVMWKLLIALARGVRHALGQTLIQAERYALLAYD